ncbi:hypothetical protein LTR56_011329 [Elasticomyces elasticus]|nr:hypothetical protein LTR56_011329 [Elasticomyces elasticus]KAK3660932.1 hypothetical protein LTR22_007760 [Elasticomyces elasticus]KAK4932338.1 hypothetical protein LTR49_001207 [Elasticomyces elasticus]KAK5768346.1 hypothetical protein LTS12_001485 [Elasticomyces elasticus]
MSKRKLDFSSDAGAPASGPQQASKRQKTQRTPNQSRRDDPLPFAANVSDLGTHSRQTFREPYPLSKPPPPGLGKKARKRWRQYHRVADSSNLDQVAQPYVANSPASLVIPSESRATAEVAIRGTAVNLVNATTAPTSAKRLQDPTDLELLRQASTTSLLAPAFKDWVEASTSKAETPLLDTRAYVDRDCQTEICGSMHMQLMFVPLPARVEPFPNQAKILARDLPTAIKPITGPSAHSSPSSAVRDGSELAKPRNSSINDPAIIPAFQQEDRSAAPATQDTRGEDDAILSEDSDDSTDESTSSKSEADQDPLTTTEQSKGDAALSQAMVPAETAKSALHANTSDSMEVDTQDEIAFLNAPATPHRSLGINDVQVDTQDELAFLNAPATPRRSLGIAAERKAEITTNRSSSSGGEDVAVTSHSEYPSNSEYKHSSESESNESVKDVAQPKLYGARTLSQAAALSSTAGVEASHVRPTKQPALQDVDVSKSAAPTVEANKTSSVASKLSIAETVSASPKRSRLFEGISTSASASKPVFGQSKSKVGSSTLPSKSAGATPRDVNPRDAFERFSNFVGGDDSSEEESSDDDSERDEVTMAKVSSGPRTTQSKTAVTEKYPSKPRASDLGNDALAANVTAPVTPSALLDRATEESDSSGSETDSESDSETEPNGTLFKPASNAVVSEKPNPATEPEQIQQEADVLGKSDDSDGSESDAQESGTPQKRSTNVAAHDVPSVNEDKGSSSDEGSESDSDVGGADVKPTGMSQRPASDAILPKTPSVGSQKEQQHSHTATIDNQRGDENSHGEATTAVEHSDTNASAAKPLKDRTPSVDHTHPKADQTISTPKAGHSEASAALQEPIEISSDSSSDSSSDDTSDYEDEDDEDENISVPAKTRLQPASPDIALTHDGTDEREPDIGNGMPLTEDIRSVPVSPAPSLSLLDINNARASQQLEEEAQVASQPSIVNDVEVKRSSGVGLPQPTYGRRVTRSMQPANTSETPRLQDHALDTRPESSTNQELELSDDDDDVKSINAKRRGPSTVVARALIKRVSASPEDTIVVSSDRGRFAKKLSSAGMQPASSGSRVVDTQRDDQAPKSGHHGVVNGAGLSNTPPISRSSLPSQREDKHSLAVSPPVVQHPVLAVQEPNESSAARFSANGEAEAVSDSYSETGSDDTDTTARPPLSGNSSTAEKTGTASRTSPSITSMPNDEQSSFLGSRNGCHASGRDPSRSNSPAAPGTPSFTYRSSDDEDVNQTIDDTMTGILNMTSPLPSVGMPLQELTDKEGGKTPKRRSQTRSARKPWIPSAEQDVTSYSVRVPTDPPEPLAAMQVNGWTPINHEIKGRKGDEPPAPDSPQRLLSRMSCSSLSNLTNTPTPPPPDVDIEPEAPKRKRNIDAEIQNIPPDDGDLGPAVAKKRRMTGATSKHWKSKKQTGAKLDRSKTAEQSFASLLEDEPLVEQPVSHSESIQKPKPKRNRKKAELTNADDSTNTGLSVDHEQADAIDESDNRVKLKRSRKTKEQPIAVGSSNANDLVKLEQSEALPEIDAQPPKKRIPKRKSKSTPKKSPHFQPTHLMDRVDTSSNSKPRVAGVSNAIVPPTTSEHFGIIQEKLWREPFWLIVAVTLLNQTGGKAAVPCFWGLKERYETVEGMATADYDDVLEMIRHLGLQRRRTDKLLKLAKEWLDRPPAVSTRYRTRNYPNQDDQRQFFRMKVVESDATDCAGALEIGHMPGCGPYAWDSWRIFCRDVLRGVAQDYNGLGATDEGFEPEWQRVVPKDKELRAALRWMWMKEGWKWDHETGSKRRATEEEIEMAKKGEMEMADAKERDFAARAVQNAAEVEEVTIKVEEEDSEAMDANDL